ncbi:hypothetical protein ONS95_006847 [Cadophora gregata]|uniref:uncharacterized protein n=1 Tax=Cadophora gregata TaxID=51156 RepID=UPI0026DC678D|nr:uncharacterized protein ONS95_006847 [Cadophora gregata]KAK0101690.1 hypothetical protein ONS95_006847 [Cadophora gregata]
MLASSWAIPQRLHRREDLPQRLPYSLQSLTIIFDVGAQVLYTEKPQELDYKWILNLAESKQLFSPRLARITLLERNFWPGLNRGKTEADFSPATDWESPPELKLAFQRADIEH